MLTLGSPSAARASVGRPQMRCVRSGASTTCRSVQVRSAVVQKRFWRLNAEKASTEASTPSQPVPEKEEEVQPENMLDADQLRKKQEADTLREQEKFMVVGAGDASCSNCGYEYKSERGDPDFPAAKGTMFEDLPEDYTCPLCGSAKDKFKSSAQEIPGFAVNQGYGFGTNSMTAGQKQGLIYGALVVFFFLFLSGYFLD